MLEAHTSILLQQQADVRLTMRTGIKREGLTMSYCRGDHSLERDETYFNHREAFVLRWSIYVQTAAPANLRQCSK
jgi:hypothetical protein